MPNYNETNVNSTSYQRSNYITISNEFGLDPIISFNEEVVVELGDGSVAKKTLGMLHGTFTNDNVSEEVFLIDPATGDLTTNTITFAQIQNTLKSLYIHMATKRDNAAAAVVVTP